MFGVVTNNQLYKSNRLWFDIALIIVLAFLPLLFFWRLITPNPADRMAIAAGDFTEQYFPLRAFTAAEWVQGRVPLWNPYLYGGQPALADIQSGALYPPHVLEALLLGWGGSLLGQDIGFPLWALELQVILHFSLAAVGTYLFARSCFLRLLASSPPRLLASSPPLPSASAFRRARFGGVVTSLVFTYGGYLTGFPVQQMTILAVSAWLPWVMWAVHTATNRPPTADRRPLKEDRPPSKEDRRPETGDLRPSKEDHHQPTTDQRRTTLETSPLLASSPPRVLFWGALAFAMAILAGHPQTVLYIFYLSLAYTLFQTFFDWSCKSASQPAGQTENDATHNSAKSPRGTQQREASLWDAIRNTQYVLRFTSLRLLASSFFYFFTSWLLIILLGAALAAAQLLPTLEFISRSLRADMSYQAVSAGLPLNELIAILYPGFFGGSPEYVGIVSLALIALALTVALSPRLSNLQPPTSNLHPPIFFWTGAALISLLLAFGGNTFLYPLFYLLIPGFEAVRQQERAFLIYSFSAAMLAGYGAFILAGPFPRPLRATYALFERRLRWVAGAALALTGLFIYGSAVSTARGDQVNLFYGVLWHHLFGLVILGGLLALLALRSWRWLRRTWGMSLLTLWLIFNLFTVNWRFNLEKPATPPPFSPNGVTQFLQSNLPPVATFQPSNPPPSPGRMVSGGLLPGGNSAASVYHLQDLTGNTPLQLAGVDTFMRQMPAWRLWQLMNVRYVLDTRDIADAGLKQVFAEDELKVFEMGDPFPRAWFVSQIEAISGDNQAIARLAADDFDLRRAAVMDEPLNTPLAETSTSTVTVTEFASSRLKAEVNASGPHLLVFSQIYYPGWQARIDGQPVELRRVNIVQQGVVVPAGEHTVELIFSPRSFWVGLIISGVGVLIGFVLFRYPSFQPF